ncbi:cation transporter [Dubosiella muris]|uniref:Heavy-metal-associated domain-containing protein n=1 Tax=Dubosiella muris TaxID=3038133 RepID=A0AC61RBY4_9FIRM|nr:cation transporter [Dubosiella muris]TGY66949.1 heavy-metal-associated domain-containing protein [Dubosiella muris]
MKKTYKVEVDCANCAAKIEDAISKIEGVNSARVNFMTQKLTIDTADAADHAAIMKEAKRCARKVDSDAEIDC